MDSSFAEPHTEPGEMDISLIIRGRDPHTSNKWELEYL